MQALKKGLASLNICSFRIALRETLVGCCMHRLSRLYLVRLRKSPSTPCYNAARGSLGNLEEGRSLFAKQNVPKAGDEPFTKIGVGAGGGREDDLVGIIGAEGADVDVC